VKGADLEQGLSGNPAKMLWQRQLGGGLPPAPDLLEIPLLKLPSPHVPEPTS